MDLLKNSNKISSKERIELILKILQILDDFSVLKRTNLEIVDNLVNKINDIKIKNLWKKYRKIGVKIVYFPYKIPKVLLLIKIKEIFRILLPLSLIYVLLVFGYIVHQNIYPKWLSFLGNPIYLLVVLIFSSIIGIGIILIDYFIRKIIIKFEENHKNVLSKYQKKMKEGAQELINLLKEMLKSNYGNEKFKCIIDLWHNDYKGIKLIKTRRAKVLFFSTNYNIYTYEITADM